MVDAEGKGRGVAAVGAFAVSVYLAARRFGRRTMARERVERRLGALVQNSSDVVAVVRADGIVEYVSPSIERITGFGPGERVGRSAFELIHPDDLEGVRSDMADLLRRPGGTTTGEFRMLRADGGVRHVEAVAANRLDEPEVGGIVVNYRDVTERRRAEEDRLRLAAIVDCSVDAISSADLRGNITSWNPGAERLYGYPAREALGRPIREVMKPRDPMVIRPNIARVGRGETVGPFDAVHHDRSGRALSVSVTLSPIRGPGGGVTGVVAVTRDVSKRDEAERALRESEERFRTAFRDAPLGVALVDLEGHFLRANSALCAMLGFTEEELMGRTSVDVTHPDDRHMSRLRARGAYDGGIGMRTQEKRYVCKNGRTVWALSSISLVRDAGGEPSHFVALYQDITGRKIVEDRLREAEEKYRTLVEQIPAVTYIDELDEISTSIYMSPQVEEMLGFTAEERVENPTLWVESLHPEDRGRVLEANDRSNATGDPFDMEYRMVARDGRVVWVHDGSVVLRGAEGRPLYRQGVMFDVTDRREAEERLEQAERWYRLLVEKVPAVVYLDGVDAENSAVYRSSHVREVLGYEPEEFLEDPEFWRRLLHPEDRGRVLAENERTNKTGEPFKIEYRMIRKDGRVVWLRDEAVLIRDAGGRPLHWQGVFMDITDRREAEERIVFQAQLLEQVQAGIIATDMEGTVIHWNRHAEELYGWSREEALGRNAWDLVVGPTEAGMAKEIMDQVREDGSWEGEFVVRHRDGSTFPAYVSDSLVRAADGRPIGIVGVSTDLTERKRAEETLRQSEERYRAVFERTTDGIFLADFDTMRIFETNAALQGMLGYTAEELSGMSVYDIVLDSPENIDRNTRRVLGESSLLLGERRYRRKDGSLLAVESSATKIPYAGREVSCCIVRDVTERKRAEDEVREANRRLEELAVLKADFTAMVAHELDTPLAVIRGFAEVISTGELDAEGLRRSVSRIQSETDVLDALVEDVRTAANVEREDFAVDPGPVPVEDLLGDADAFAGSLPGGHGLVVRDDVGGAVEADRYRIGQVLRNLLSNAAKYSPDGSPVELRVLPGGDGRVRFEVADRGGGIPPEDAARIFEKFGRGRDGRNQKGLGLGLYLSRRILQAHGGDLTLRPNPEGGSVFGFELGRAG